MRGDNLTKPTVGELLDREQQRRPSTVIAPANDPSKPDVRLGGGPLPSPG